MKVAINGFGRVGRAVFRMCASDPDLEVVAINDAYLSPQEVLYLCKYDSTYGTYNHDVRLSAPYLLVGHNSVLLMSERDLQNAPLRDTGCDVVVEASGDTANLVHWLPFLQQCPFRTVFTNYLVDEKIVRYIYGIDDVKKLDSAKLISLGTCDSGAVLPTLRYLDNTVGIASASVITLHPYLGSQNLLDSKSPSQDTPALGRAVFNNLIPKASSSLQRIISDYFVDNNVMVMTFRVPTNIVGNASIHLVLKRQISKSHLEQLLVEWCEGRVADVGKVSYDPCVSLDFRQMPYSFIIDMSLIGCVDNLARLSIWYDNEWGYSSRVYDCVKYLSERTSP